jgi:hypothetical protein
VLSRPERRCHAPLPHRLIPPPIKRARILVDCVVAIVSSVKFYLLARDFQGRTQASVGRAWRRVAPFPMRTILPKAVGVSATICLASCRRRTAIQTFASSTSHQSTPHGRFNYCDRMLCALSRAVPCAKPLRLRRLAVRRPSWYTPFYSLLNHPSNNVGSIPSRLK